MYNMRLTEKAVEVLNTVSNRTALAAALGRSDQTIYKLLKQNKDNSLLTTITALGVIREATGFSDSEILTSEAVAA